MKRAALLVLTLALVLPFTFFFAEAPATAQTCEDVCRQEAFQCTQLCQGGPFGAFCRDECAQEYHACVDACP